MSSFGPVALAPDTEYEVVMSIDHAIWGLNADGIQSVVDTDTEELFTFTTATAVPLPSTMIFFGSGLAGLVGLRIRKKEAGGRVGGSSWGRAKLTDCDYTVKSVKIAYLLPNNVVFGIKMGNVHKSTGRDRRTKRLT